MLDAEELRDGFGDKAVRPRRKDERTTAVAPLIEVVKHHRIHVGRHLFAHEFVAPGLEGLSRKAREKPHGERHHFVEREGARVVFAVEPAARLQKLFAQARLFDQKDGPAVSRIDRQERVVEVKYGQFHCSASVARCCDSPQGCVEDRVGFEKCGSLCSTCTASRRSGKVTGRCVMRLSRSTAANTRESVLISRGRVRSIQFVIS